MGPKTAKGRDEMKTSVTMGPRCLFGTSSPRTVPKDSCPAAPMPLQPIATISIATFWAAPPRAHPMRLRMEVLMTIHLRPYRSDRRPTRRKPIDDPIVQMVAAQEILADGPRSALMSVLYKV
jgi:hypothetical protein